ncbi:MAG: hypothetical protein WCS70_08350 [Verrucomicrobiota bacterium]
MALALISICLLGFIPYLVLVWRAPEMRWPQVRSTILVFALLFRIGLLCLPAPLTTDTARYLWDGKIQVYGFNPYAHTPNAPELTHLRDANWEKLDHRDVASVYPPILLLLFRLVATVAPHQWTFRLLFTVFDLLTFRLIVRLLRSRKQSPAFALIWGLNPLVMLEFAGSGHEMSLAIMFFIAGFWLLQTRLTPVAALAFALATLAHLIALPLAITVLATARIRSVRIWLWYFLPLAAGYALFIDAGHALWTSLLNVAGLWQFNGSLYEVLAGILDRNNWQERAGVWIVHEHTKIVCAILLAGLFVWLVRRRVNPVRAALTMAGSILLLSSTVHPWYVTWLVALVCVEFSLAWLVFSATVLVSYVARITQLQTGIWVDAAFTRWLEYTPVFLLLAVELWRKRFDTTATGQ